MKRSALAYFDRSLLVTIPLAVVLGIGMVFFVEGILWGLNALREITWHSVIPFWLLPIIGGFLVGGMVLFTHCERAPGLIDLQNYSRHHRSSCHHQGLTTKDVGLSLVVHGIALSCATYSGMLGPLAYWSGWVGKQFHRLIPDGETRPMIIERHVMGSAVAAALAATLSAPLAAVFFVYEVMLRQPNLKRLFPIALAALTASLSEQYFFNREHALAQLPLLIRSYWEYGVFALIGLVAGGVAVLLSLGVLAMRNSFARYVASPALRPVMGGFMLAIMLFFLQGFLPRDLDSDQIVILLDRYSVNFGLLWILPILCVAVAISIGAGYGSGVFAPALLIGGLLGGSFWTLCNAYIIPLLGDGVVASDIGVYAMVGVAAFSGALMGAPFFAVMLAFEFSLSYSITSVTILASFLSAEVMSSLCAPSLFHLLRDDRH